MTDNLPGPDDARGQQRELIGLAVDDQRVSGVVAALKTHHDVGRNRQPIDDLALALVAPLGADHDHIRHRRAIPRPCQKQKPRRQRQWAGPGLIARMDYAIGAGGESRRRIWIRARAGRQTPVATTGALPAAVSTPEGRTARFRLPLNCCLGPGRHGPGRSGRAGATGVRSRLTLVPTCTRSKRSITSSFIMRMQPEETFWPIVEGSLVPWMRNIDDPR